MSDERVDGEPIVRTDIFAMLIRGEVESGGSDLEKLIERHEAAVIERLLPYMHHQRHCEVWMSRKRTLVTAKCTCGLDEIVKGVKK